MTPAALEFNPSQIFYILAILCGLGLGGLELLEAAFTDLLGNMQRMERPSFPRIRTLKRILIAGGSVFALLGALLR